MDMFHSESFLPMSIQRTCRPFDSKEYIYELKLSGIRCIAYLDETSTHLRSKESKSLNAYFPELISINAHVKCKCILDGEIIVLKHGVSDRYGIKKRMPIESLNPLPILCKEFPVSFIAFDILYMNNKPLMHLPLLERKKLLEETVNDTVRLSTSRYIQQHGISMFHLAKRNKLEGIIAKHIKSCYYPGSQTTEWINVLVSAYHYYVVCGYFIHNSERIKIIIGQFRENELIYKGKIATNLDPVYMNRFHVKRTNTSPFRLTPICREKILWLTPSLACEVITREDDKKNNGTRTFLRIVPDKPPEECIELDYTKD